MPIADLLQKIRDESPDPQPQGRRVPRVQEDPQKQRKQREEQTAALVETIKKARSDIESAVSRLQTATLELRSVTRRNFDESASSLLVFSNAHLRLCGAMTQAVHRTASMDRVLVRAEKDREEARVREQEYRRQREAQAQVKEHSKLIDQLKVPTEDDFDALYGEIVTDAS
jgi:hypothetical protein